MYNLKPSNLFLEQLENLTNKSNDYKDLKGYLKRLN
jgi:hypothetical protein